MGIQLNYILVAFNGEKQGNTSQLVPVALIARIMQINLKLSLNDSTENIFLE